MTESATLATFVQQAKASASEAVLVPLIRAVLSAPDVFVFGELLELDTLKQLAANGGEGAKWVQLLEIFAFGRFSDYARQKGALAPATMNEKQVRKLRQLSIVALAHESRVIAYPTLMAELELNTLRELEDLVIDALYRELLVAKLDHAKQQLEVAHAIGRDVRVQDVGALVASVQEWTTRAEQLLGVLDELGKRARETAEAHTQHDVAVAKKLEEMRSMVKQSLDADSDAGMAAQLQMQQMQQMGLMGMMGDDRRAGKKDKHKPGQQQQGRHMH